GHLKRGHYYRIIDEYTLFYLNWIEPIINSIRHHNKPLGYWENLSTSPTWKSWSGYAFEAICYKHITAIRETLSIPVTAEVGSWRYSPRLKSSEKGAQIDLLFDRKDDAVTLCEIKYTNEPFRIDKSYAGELLNKVNVYKKHTGVTKHIFIAMITSDGLKPTMYSEELISHQVTLSDFFKPIS
ncbi:MAG: AAA family ATPase, partial [Gammaproteobacteria bacterium]